MGRRPVSKTKGYPKILTHWNALDCYWLIPNRGEYAVRMRICDNTAYNIPNDVRLYTEDILRKLGWVEVDEDG